MGFSSKHVVMHVVFVDIMLCEIGSQQVNGSLLQFSLGTFSVSCLQLPTKLWHDEKVNTETSGAAASEQIFTGVNPWSSRPDMLWASARANGPGPYQRHPGLIC